MMAKHPRRRRNRKYLRGNIDEDHGYAALASKDVVLTVFDETVDERTLISSLVAVWSNLGLTPAAGVGPIMVGIAHSSYTAAQIEEWIENTGAWSEGSLVNQEIAKRKIRRIGVFDNRAAATQTVTLNDGKAIKTKLNWILTQGQGLAFWTYNMGTAAVATTSPVANAQGHANLWPL